jgi:hypothetical protein
MENKSNRRERSKDKFFSLIPVFEKSGLSQVVFCKEHDLAYSTFQYWLKKFRKEEIVSPAFVEVKIPAIKNISLGVEILLPTGAKIICYAHSNISLVRSLIL